MALVLSDHDRQLTKKGEWSVKKSFGVRLKQAAVIVGSTAGVILLSTGASFASSGPTFYSGETVDVFTLPGYGHTGLTITLSSNTGGSFNQTIPLTYVGHISGNFAPDWANNWGSTWDEYSFQMPTGATVGHTYGALITLPSGGAVFTQFVGYPDPAQSGYGTQFTYTAPSTLPTGQAPEVPYAVALPLIVVGVWGALQLRRHRVTSLH